MMPSPEQFRDAEPAEDAETTDSSMTDAGESSSESSSTGFKARFADGVVTYFDLPPRGSNRPADALRSVKSRIPMPLKPARGSRVKR